jgi:hypothetical protein
MLAQQNNNYELQDWRNASEVWDGFANKHPQLRLKSGKWAMHNFLRSHKEQLRCSDVIRLVRGRFWIADAKRFDAAAFSCATGVTSTVSKPDQIPTDSKNTDNDHLSMVIDQPREIVVRGLTPNEHLRQHEQLSFEIAELVLNQLEKLKAVAIAAADAMPGCIWAAEHMTAGDAKRLQGLLVALHNVNRD